MKKMVNEKSWKEFRESGLLWFINTILHVAGWALVLDIEAGTGEIVAAYPARCKFRGFSGDINDAGYKAVAHYFKENAGELAQEVEG